MLYLRATLTICLVEFYWKFVEMLLEMFVNLFEIGAMLA